MKLHLGSGPVRLEGWTNVDLDAPEADMHLDLRAELPFEVESVTHIYNEHFIEHITRAEAVDLLRECHRILKKDGVLRLSTPNLKFIAVCYLSRNTTEWGASWKPASPCSLLNESMRLWGHQFVYDAEELIAVLTEAGFDSVQFVNYGESTVEPLVGLESRPFHNELIVEARKNSGLIEAPGGLIGEYPDSELWLDDVNRAILRQVELSQQVSAGQAAHILNVEAELTARGQYIVELEQRSAGQAAHILNVEAELTARGQHIAELKQCSADQATHIHSVVADWNARGQHINKLENTIADQTNHISDLDAELVIARLSWFRKLKIFSKKSSH